MWLYELILVIDMQAFVLLDEWRVLRWIRCRIRDGELKSSRENVSLVTPIFSEIIILLKTLKNFQILRIRENLEQKVDTTEKKLVDMLPELRENVQKTLRLMCKRTKNVDRVFFGFGNSVLVYFRPQERFAGEYFWPGSQPAPMMRLPGCRRSISKPFPIRRRPEIRFNARHQGTCEAEKSMCKLLQEHF